MRKYTIFVVCILLIGKHISQNALAQTNSTMGGVPMEEMPMQPMPTGRSLRIVFEGTFYRNKTPNMSQFDYPVSLFATYGTLFPRSNQITVGFDATNTLSSGRRFVVSTRTSFSSGGDFGNRKETWLKLHTSAEKQSSVVVDFSIRVIHWIKIKGPAHACPFYDSYFHSTVRIKLKPPIDRRF